MNKEQWLIILLYTLETNSTDLEQHSHMIYFSHDANYSRCTRYSTYSVITADRLPSAPYHDDASSARNQAIRDIYIKG